MRSRQVLQATSSQTVCIFCAHRLGGDTAGLASCRPLPVQRRHINSSRSPSQSAAYAVAYRQDEVESERSAPVANTSGAGSWDQTFAKHSSGLSLEEERENQAIRARLLGTAVHAQQRPTTTAQSQSSGSSLTPEEQRMRDALLARSNTSSSIESNRNPERRFAGNRRPLFDSYDHPQPRQNGRSQRKEDRGYPRNSRDAPHFSRGQYRFKLNSARSDVPEEPSYKPELTSQWNHLTRRTAVGKQDVSAEPRHARRDDPRLQEYMQQSQLREQQAKTQKFVGFGERPVRQELRNGPSPRRTTPYLGTVPQSLQNVDDNQVSTINTVGIKNDIQGQPEPGQVEAVIEESIQRSGRELRRSKRIQARAEEEQKEGETIIRSKERKSKSKKLSGADPDLEDLPRGRGRDRARRRDRFESEDYDEIFDEDDKRAASKKQRKKEKERAAQQHVAAGPTPIYLPEYITVSNLATALKVRIDDFVARMEELGFENINYDYVLNAENAGLIAMEYNYDPIIDRSEAEEDLHAAPAAEDKSVLPQRPPVVTIMGHVDHGKTTILDFLRKSSDAATEFGGITQHIGAFSVPLSSGKKITFLDTPGHAAFLSMRQRGANVTDIVVLVVAADDSVKPQTIEAIKHAQAARVPIIVAINKIDKEEAAPERVKQDLARHGIDVEDFGGDTQVVCVSGKTGQGMQELEEAVVTLSEILDHRAETDGPVEGWILEATTRKAGRVATVLVRRGTLRVGDIVVAGKTWARVRTLRNEAGVVVDSVCPGMPVEVDGWKGQPEAGDEVLQAPDEQKATSVVEFREAKDERAKLAKDMEAINDARRLEQEKREKEEASAKAETEGTPVTEGEEAEEGITSPGLQEVYFIVKADVSGSAEAVVNSVSALGNSEVRAHILRSGVGPVAEFDVEHAAVAKGHIISFNTTIEPKIAQMAEAAGVQIFDNNVIYRLVDDVKAKLSERLPSVTTQRVTGEAEIAQSFSINVGGRKQVLIAGCKVRNGVVARGNKVRVLRGKDIVYDGSLSSLKNVKKDVAEMRKDTECGMGFEKWEGFQVGDRVQCYEEKVEKRSL